MYITVDTNWTLYLSKWAQTVPTSDRIPLYRDVASRVLAMIDAGTFAPGDRVPSVRALSRQLSVSISTVLEAYRLLESQRVVEARPQSGYFVRPRGPVPEIPARSKSGRRTVPIDSSDLILNITESATDPNLVALGSANPCLDYLPVARLNRFLGRVIREHPTLSHEYDSISGVEELRVMIARRMLEAGCSVSPDAIVTTAGATAAIQLCLRAVTKPGDTVAVESPTYYGLLEAIDALHLRAIEVATCPEEGIDLDELEKIVSRQRVAACALVPNHGNPLGHCMPDDKKRQLVELLNTHDIPLVEDDAYGDLPFGNERPRAVKAFDPDDRVLYCSSFSKTLAPGFRVGWAAPGRYLDRVKRLKFSSFIATPSCTQMAIAQYLEHGGFDRHLRSLRRTYRELMDRMIHVVGDVFPAGTRATRPAGGHVLWVELPEHVDSMLLREQAAQAGVSVLPGPVFSPTGRYRNFIRLNCALTWGPPIEHALQTLAHLAQQQ